MFEPPSRPAPRMPPPGGIPTVSPREAVHPKTKCSHALVGDGPDDFGDFEEVAGVAGVDERDVASGRDAAGACVIEQSHLWLSHNKDVGSIVSVSGRFLQWRRR